MPLKDPEARARYQREFRLKNIERYRQKDRDYRETHAEQVYERNRRYVEANRDKHRQWTKKACKKWRKTRGPKYYKEYAQKEGQREKHNANATVYRALRRGQLIRPDHCVLCRRPCKPHAHHDDYAKPLEVVWLCSPCHKEADKKRALREAQN